jgi:hypothetical protein
MAKLFDTSRENVTLHTTNIFKGNELIKPSVCKDLLLTGVPPTGILFLPALAHNFAYQHDHLLYQDDNAIQHQTYLHKAGRKH